VCDYFAFTVAIPITDRSLIIRTEIRMIIRERLKIEVFILAVCIRLIIGINGISSRVNWRQ
jgi:hypothetical protein